MSRWAFSIALLLFGFATANAQEEVARPPRDGAPSPSASSDTQASGPTTRGELRLAPSKSSAVYRKKWALIVGVNYERRDDARSTAKDAAALPALSNAVKDAKGTAEVLRKYYAFDEENVIELLEEQATKAAIEAALGALCDTGRVLPQDCVLVFFSGHGVRSSRGTSFLAHDVQLAQGAPVSGNLRLQEDIVGRLEDCPAKHKLLILDHCYSGDVFNKNFQPPSVQDRSDRALMHEQAFQAMASCRATQVALDAGQLNQGHSPFTAALLDGLTRLPANGDPSAPIGTTKLASYIATTFDVETQKPESRNLIATDGEFSFWPADVSFDHFRVKDGDRNLLNAMTSRHRGWWFHERPWFIPAVRSLILDQLVQSQAIPRGSIHDQYIDEVALRAAAEKAFTLRKGSYHESTKRHYDMLVAAQGTNKFQDTLKEICAELEARMETWRASESDGVDKPLMKEEEIHLLAILQHALKKSEAAHETYRLAEAVYKNVKESGPAKYRISSALCAADHGELLLEDLGKANEAAEKFREAENGIRSLTEERDAGAVFRMSVMCREANAYLRINRWKAANRLLDDALALTEQFAPGSYFAAQVYRNRAWAQLNQWEMREARKSFEKSNEIITKELESKLHEMSQELADGEPLQKPTLLQAEHPAAQAAFRGLKDFDAFQASHDFASKLSYLHNLHGIAMVQRFQGDTLNASQNYRSLVRHVEATFSDLTQDATTETMIRMYVTRSVNTQERLGDCNLFGDPEHVDIKEAIDDYRRARNMAHRLSGIQRRQTEAILLYKMALAMALPSAVRDTEMAIEMCKRADAIFEVDEQSRTATGHYWTLGKLTTAMVNLLDQNACLAGDASPCPEPAAALREAILACRDALGRHPHRDQLEILLFASKLLLQYAPEESRFQVAEDADLLLAFCRLALVAHRFDGRPLGSESTAYLRPYYDAVMRAKLAITDRKHVLDLLEIQAEATTGTYYMKSEDAQPILATYLLDDACYLLVDLPRGISKVFPLASIYDAATIHHASYGGEQLTLPGEVLGELNRWSAENRKRLNDATGTEHVRIDVRWMDPVREPDEVHRLAGGAPPGTHAVEKPRAPGSCPFVLPRGFQEIGTQRRGPAGPEEISQSEPATSQAAVSLLESP